MACMLCVGLQCLIYFIFVYRRVHCMHVMYTLLHIITCMYMYVHVCIGIIIISSLLHSSTPPPLHSSPPPLLHSSPPPLLHSSQLQQCRKNRSLASLASLATTSPKVLYITLGLVTYLEFIYINMYAYIHRSCDLSLHLY